MGYLDELRAFNSENPADMAPTKPTEPSFVSSVSTSSARLVEDPGAVLRDWHEHLSRLDQLVTPPGWRIDDWLRLTDDAFYLYEGQASYAVRNGWTAQDLFGVRPGYPERGGLADLLRGARNLKLSGGKAYWSRLGAAFSIGIGIGKGCTLLWELS